MYDIGAFYQACETGDLNVLRRELDGGAPVGGDGRVLYGRNPFTPLYLACGYERRSRGSSLPERSRDNRLQAATLLIERGADVNEMRSHKLTPLMAACYNNDYELALLLLNRGAIVDQVFREIDNTTHLTALIAACYVHSEDRAPLARLLISRGAAVNRPMYSGQNMCVPLSTAMCGTCRPEAAHRARKLALLRVLLESGADINYCRYRSDTPGGKGSHIAFARESFPYIVPLFRKHMAITIRKCVIGGHAEHPARNRMKHLVPQIASFLIGGLAPPASTWERGAYPASDPGFPFWK